MKKNLCFVFILFIFPSIGSLAQWLPPNGPGNEVWAITSVGTKIFAGMHNNGYYGGIWQTNDTGQTWSYAGLGGESINTFEKAGNLIFAGTTNNGILYSPDTSHTWIQTGLMSHDVRDIIVNGNFIYAATDSGFYYSSDSGATFSIRNTGITNINLYSLFSIGNRIFSGSSFGLFTSTDTGNTWIPSGLASTSINKIEMSGSILFAATYSGMYLSNDTGHTWNSINNGIPTTQIETMVISGTTIFAGTTWKGNYVSMNNGSIWTPANNGFDTPEKYLRNYYQFGSVILSASGGGVFISFDQGSTWEGRNFGISNGIAFGLTANNSTLLLGDVFVNYKSTDNGITWNVMDSSLGSSSEVQTFLTVGNIIFAGGAGGRVYKSTDTANHWIPCSNGIPTSSAVMVLASHGTYIFAGTYNNGVYYSADSGSTWTSFNSGLTTLNLSSFAFMGSSIFAGTAGGGIFRSTTVGGSWIAVNNGISNFDVLSMTSSGTNLIAGTYGGGIYVSSDLGSTWTSTLLTDPYIASLLSDGGSYVFAGGLLSDVFMSSDYGQTWDTITWNLFGNIIALGLNNSYLYAGTQGRGVWRRPLSELGFSSAVWPGDCNSDLSVNNYDFLNLGLAWNDIGAARPGASLAWTAQPANNWTLAFPSGANHKHADTNGDGVVNANDSAAIYLNYNQAHFFRPVAQQQGINADFQFVPNHTVVSPGDTIVFEIRIANSLTPVDSLYGIAFSILFDPSMVDPNSIQLNYSSSILGVINADMKSFEKDFYSSGKIDVALTRINHSNAVNSYGVLGTITLVISQTVASATTLSVSPSAVIGITIGEQQIVFNSVTNSVLIDPALLLVKDNEHNSLILVYPNPANNMLSIQSSDKEIRKIEMFDARGRKVVSESAESKQVKLSIKSIESGFYLVAITTGEKVLHHKIQILHIN